ncbi:MAG: protein kinase [Sandaracinaceae bacterium]|nr:protein kinase [Sandaracinaceae bacterium]
MREYYLRLNGGRVRLEPGSYTIGRGAGVDVWLDDPDIARTHATLWIGADAAVLQDSSGGRLLVNDRPVNAATEVRAGDRIQLARSELTLLELAVEGRAPATARVPDDPEDLIGRTLAGRYTIRRALGQGGMGRVFVADQTSLGRRVAVKVLHPHLAADEEIVSRFYTEARAASRVSHPNAVAVIDFGRSRELLYMAMELVEGVTLAELLDLEGPLPARRACELAIGALGALGEAHSLGITHRDVKPANIMVKPLREGREVVKVLDFGLAKIANRPRSAHATQPGFACGTPEYMSPQQAAGEKVDSRTDLYSLGATLFELLTGTPPFRGDDPLRVMLRHMRDPVPDPRDRVAGADLSDELARVVMRSLAKDPADRFQTAMDLRAALTGAFGPS